MNKYLFNHRCELTIGMLAVLLLATSLGGWYFVVQKQSWLKSQIDFIEPRFARLKGLESELGSIVDSIDKLQAEMNKYLAGNGSDHNQVGNEALQRVRKILESSGFEVSSAQVVIDVKNDGFNKIGLIIKGDANINSLMTSLSGINDLRPILIVDSLVVQSTGLSQPHVAQRIVVQLNLSLIRGKS